MNFLCIESELRVSLTSSSPDQPFHLQSARVARATGITNYLKNGGTLEVAQRIASHADSRTTELYDRRGPLGTMVIAGPKVLEFYNDFCNHHATSLKSDGKDILKVTMVLNAERDLDAPSQIH
jgi:hypothetical protein